MNIFEKVKFGLPHYGAFSVRQVVRPMAQWRRTDDTFGSSSHFEVNLMRGLWITGAAALSAAIALTACVSTPSLNGTTGAPSFADLQTMCSAQPVDYGNDAQSVYVTLFDAYVASKRGGLSKADYCTFQGAIAQRYSTLAASGDPQARLQWVEFFNAQRAKALSWRAAVDPTLRSG
jgi:hypothetical protein